MNETKLIEEALENLWDQVREVVTKVLSNCEIYGLELMHLADPDMETVVRTMDNVAIPLLDHIISSEFVSDYEQVKLVNIRQYAWRLRQISKAIGDEDQALFREHFEALTHESELL